MGADRLTDPSHSGQCPAIEQLSGATDNRSLSPKVSAVDLDLAQVRAFAVAAELLHFGRAAEQMTMSQQALSKRIARLEALLGVQLFDRGGAGGRGLRLTEAGERFLEPARRTLTAGEHAVASVLGTGRRLRIDVWGHLYAPMRTVAQVLETLPDADVEPGAGRDLPSVAAALLRGEIDAGFGRVHPLPDQQDAGLTHRLVRLEPVDAIVGIGHPLANATELRPNDLRDSLLWCPADVERLDFLQRFAEVFGITAQAGGPNLGLPHFLARLRTDPGCFSLFPADCPLSDASGIRSIPLVAPVPLYAWSLIWRDDHQHPRLDTLVRGFAQAAAGSRWLEYDPEQHWLPEAEGLGPLPT
jgi:DNA-binding transcriptional LysR family regulator